MELPTDIRSDIPIPPGRVSPFGALGRLVEFLKDRRPGESFTIDSGCTAIYRAASKAGVEVKRRKLPDKGGWIYWRVS
jgi:hypothetical protein